MQLFQQNFALEGSILLFHSIFTSFSQCLQGSSYQSERAKRASFGIGCVKGRRILLFVVYDLRYGWTKLGEIFRDYLGQVGERPRERIC